MLRGILITAIVGFFIGKMLASKQSKPVPSDPIMTLA